MILDFIFQGSQDFKTASSGALLASYVRSPVDNWDKEAVEQDEKNRRVLTSAQMWCKDLRLREARRFEKGIGGCFVSYIFTVPFLLLHTVSPPLTFTTALISPLCSIT